MNEPTARISERNLVRDLVESLEAHLGDPCDPDTVISFERILDLDEREAYPHLFLDALHAWGAHDYAIPATWGGRAINLETSLHLVRQVARRDSTAATALSISSLSYMPVWVAGTEEQRVHYGSIVSNGGKISWGLSERDHGSDLLANEMSATRVPGGYLVSGEKWLIGNATLASHVVLFVRTAARGPAAFTLLVLDKRSLPAGQVQHLPGERLHGLRGIDMSGVRLSKAFVPETSVIGKEGMGLEVAMKASHAVRCLIVGIPLGCADTALRLALDFATERHIFGRRLCEIPFSRRQLVDAYAEMVLADCLASTSARALQVVPSQSSLHSAASKYLVPTLLGGTMSDLALVLGARHYLRTDSRFGAFQKLLRDAPVAAFADGNTVVNLRVLASQLPTVLADREPTPVQRLEVLFNYEATMPGFQPWHMELASRGGAHDVMDGLEECIDTLTAEGMSGLAEAGRMVAAEVDLLRERLTASLARKPREVSGDPDVLDLTHQFCLLHAAVCVLGTWTHNDPVPPEAVAVWAIRRALLPLGRHVNCPPEVEQTAAEHLLDLHARGTSFSVREQQLSWSKGAS